MFSCSHIARRWLPGFAASVLGIAGLILSGGHATAVPKDEPAKKDPPAKVEPKKDDNKKPAEDPDDLGIPNIDDIIKNLPPGFLDPDQMKQMQEQMKQLNDLLRKQMRNGGGGGIFINPMLPGGGLPGLPGAARGAVPRPEEGRLGVRVGKPSDAMIDQLDLPKGQGVVIEDVTADSAAAKAGMKTHDILLELNGKPVPSDAQEMAKLVREIKADTPVDALVLRKGRKETLKGLKLPEAKAVERPNLQGADGFPGLPGADGLPGLPGNIFPNLNNRATVTIHRNNDQFNAREHNGNVTITASGTLADGKATLKELRVKDGGETKTYESLDKVPEQYRDKAKSLVEMVENGKGRVEIRNR
jgi:hypothetical protein